MINQYYRIKPKEISDPPSYGTYITKEEKKKTILKAVIFLMLYTIKLKFKFRKRK